MKPNIDTIVQFSGLKPGRYVFDYALDNSFFKTFENEELKDGNVDVEVHLERKERMLLFTFSFHGTVKTTCDRCLGEMEIPVEGEETLCVKFSDTETSDDDTLCEIQRHRNQRRRKCRHPARKRLPNRPSPMDVRVCGSPFAHATRPSRG